MRSPCRWRFTALVCTLCWFRIERPAVRRRQLNRGEREREIQTDRQTQKQKNRQINRRTEERDRRRDKHKQRETNRRTDWKTGRQNDRHTERDIKRKTPTVKGRQRQRDAGERDHSLALMFILLLTFQIHHGYATGRWQLFEPRPSSGIPLWISQQSAGSQRYCAQTFASTSRLQHDHRQVPRFHWSLFWDRMSHSLRQGQCHCRRWR